MSVRIIASFAAVAATTLLITSPARSAVVMSQPFNTTLVGGNFSATAAPNPLGTVDDSANGGGIWSASQADAQTDDATGYGNPDLGGGLRVRDRASAPGGVVNGDIGSSISSGTVTVSLDLRRATRGGIIGGRATSQLTNAAGDTSDMLFGVIWEHNFVYPLNPVPAGYYYNGGNTFFAVANNNPNWSTLTFTLDFSTDTYSVAIGELGQTWTNLPMNTTAGHDFLKYIYLEAVDGPGGDVYYDNIVVDHVEVPEPAVMGLLTAVGATTMFGRRFRGVRSA